MTSPAGQPETIKVRPDGLLILDCGMWVSQTAGLQQIVKVARRAQGFGWHPTSTDLRGLAVAEEMMEQSADIPDSIFDAHARALEWLEAHAPEGCGFGYQAMDFWFMPQQWWDDLGGPDQEAEDEIT